MKYSNVCNFTHGSSTGILFLVEVLLLLHWTYFSSKTAQKKKRAGFFSGRDQNTDLFTLVTGGAPLTIVVWFRLIMFASVRASNLLEKMCCHADLFTVSSSC